MAGLGELFIQLGVVADTKELDAALKNVKNAIKLGDKQFQQTKRLLEYRKQLANAVSKEAKQQIKDNFARIIRHEKEKEKLQEQANSIKANIKANKALEGNLKKLVGGLAAFAGIVTGAAIAVNKLTNDLVQSNQAMLNLTRTSDISLSTFQKWGSIGKMLGVNNAAQQLEGLNQRLFELRLTGQGARGFQLAGINPTGDADAVMEQLRARVSGMSDTSASYLLREMGLDPQMLHLLRMGREEFEALGKTVKKYQLTDKQRADIQKMNIQLEIARQKLQYLKDRALIAIMPYWTTFIKSIARVTEGLIKTVKWLKSTKLGIAAIAGAIITILIPAIRALYLAISSHPIVAALSLALGALYLLVDDIIVFFKGGKSGIGVVLYFFDELKKQIQSFASPPILKDLIYLIKHSDVLLNILKYLNSYGLLQKTLQFAVDKEKENPNSSKPISRAVQGGKNVIKYFNLDYLFDDNNGSTNNIEKQKAKRNMFENFLNGVKILNSSLKFDNHAAHMSIIPPMREYSYFNNDNRTANTNNNMNVSMTNNIQTNQPAYDILRELRYINAQFA